MSNHQMTGTKSHPVMLSQAVLAGLHAFFGGSTAVSLIVSESELLAVIFAFGNLAVAAAQIGVASYVQGMVVPAEDVVEFRDGVHVVAGPANNQVDPGVSVRAVGAEKGDTDVLTT